LEKKSQSPVRKGVFNRSTRRGGVRASRRPPRADLPQAVRVSTPATLIEPDRRPRQVSPAGDSRSLTKSRVEELKGALEGTVAIHWSELPNGSQVTFAFKLDRALSRSMYDDVNVRVRRASVDLTVTPRPFMAFVDGASDVTHHSTLFIVADLARNVLACLQGNTSDLEVSIFGRHMHVLQARPYQPLPIVPVPSPKKDAVVEETPPLPPYEVEALPVAV
jgi:hypothetical protein